MGLKRLARLGHALWEDGEDDWLGHWTIIIA
jgi:hypothetical protein